MKKTTTHIVHAAILPMEGMYSVKRITASEFFAQSQAAHAKGVLNSLIAYASILKVIEQETGIRLAPSVRKLELQHGDTVLVMRLKYELGNKPEQRDITGPDNFIFEQVRYLRELPALPREVAEALTPYIFDTDAGEWLMAYLEATGQAEKLRQLYERFRLFSVLEPATDAFGLKAECEEQQGRLMDGICEELAAM